MVKQSDICFRLPWWGKENERFVKSLEYILSKHNSIIESDLVWKTYQLDIWKEPI
jgi:hypothetical protein